MNWDRVHQWKRSSRLFTVVIECREEKPSDGMLHRHGNFRWNIYAYIYPAHPHFAAFAGDKHRQPATTEMPLHGGCTYLKFHRSDIGTVASVQVGCDYAHDGDDHYTYMGPSDAALFQLDAQRLVEWLNEKAMQPIKTPAC